MGLSAYHVVRLVRGDSNAKIPFLPFISYSAQLATSTKHFDAAAHVLVHSFMVKVNNIVSIVFRNQLVSCLPASLHNTLFFVVVTMHLHPIAHFHPVHKALLPVNTDSDRVVACVLLVSLEAMCEAVDM